MLESGSAEYIQAFDACRDAYYKTRFHSPFEAMAAGFAAGVAYGRNHPEPPEGMTP